MRVLLPLLTIAACGVPAAPLEPADTARTVLERASTPEQLDEALALADLPPLPFPRPQPTADYDEPGFWHACALLWDHDVSEARGRLARAEALSGWAASQGPLGFEAEIEDFGHWHEHAELTFTFDLLSLIGLGRGGAARALAQAEVRETLAALEAAVWAARFRVDRARLRVASWRLLHHKLGELLAQAAGDERRIDLLEQRGWVAPADTGFARGMVNRLRHEVLDAHTELVAAVGELAVASGLRPDHPALAAVGERTIDRLSRASPPAPPAAVTLLERHPRLRAARLRYALAETGVRRAAAGAWPELRVGPRATITPSETLPGGVLSFELPFPGATNRAVAAALAERDAARRAVETALVEHLAALAAAGAHLHDQLAARPGVSQYESGTAIGWRAVRARFAVDAMHLMPWMTAVEQRLMAVEDWVQAREHVALASLDFDEAAGPER